MTFTMWSFGHLLFLVSPIIVTYFLHIYAKEKSFEQKRKIGIYLSLFAILLLVLRNIEIWVRKDYGFDIELVPLQVCHFANFVLLYAFWKNSKIAFSLAFTLNLAAAFLSILFADGLENYTTLICFRGLAYIVGHMLIVVLTVWAFLNDFVKFDKVTFKKTLIAIVSIFIASIFVNNFFGIVTGKYSNYFYTNHPELGTPLEWFWNFGTVTDYNGFEVNWVYYILSIILLCFVAFLFYIGGKKYIENKK